jgi:hypothetical protein
MPTDWHLVHYGAMARGGAALVMTEATAVHPEGRISQADAGIWTDQQALAYRRITDFIRNQGAQPAIQLAHAGCKASVTDTWSGNSYVDPADGGWEPVAPSPIAYPDGDKPVPRELTAAEVEELVDCFASAASRARRIRGRRNPRCTRLPHPRVPVPSDQSPRGCVRGFLGGTVPGPARHRHGSARSWGPRFPYWCASLPPTGLRADGAWKTLRRRRSGHAARAQIWPISPRPACPLSRTSGSVRAIKFPLPGWSKGQREWPRPPWV